jgi:hypothetical protein
MTPPKKELKGALKFGIKTLIFQEVRLLRLERGFMPHLILEAESHSVEETKKEIVKLVRALSEEDRGRLLKKMVRETVDEEIDRAVQLRGNRCLRCIHMRYFDQEGVPHMALPAETTKPQPFGCDALPPGLKKKCHEFVETSMAASLDDYLNDMILLYEFREIFGKIEKIWEDYFAK